MGSDGDRIPWLLCVAAGVLSGVALWTAFPPIDFGAMAFVALVPLALVFRVSGWGRVSVAALAFSAVFFGLLIRWVLLFGAPAYLALAALQVLWVTVVLYGGVTARQWLPGTWKLLAFPLAMIAAEYLRGRAPLQGFTWGGLGYSQHDFLSFLKIASFGGVWGVGFVVALVNSLLAEAFGKAAARRVPSAALLALGAVACIGLPVLIPVHNPSGTRADVALVQGNLPGLGGGEGESHSTDDPEVVASHAQLTKSLRPGEVDLVVWPESTLDHDPGGDSITIRAIEESIRSANAPMLVGASINVEGQRFRNRVLFYDDDGQLRRTYDKIHLVPYGEYVPFRKILEPLIAELARVPRDGIPGERPVVFEIPGGRLSAVICFESTFPGLVRRFVQNGARFLVVTTNNSSFERTEASAQHVAFSQLRAAEHRMWVGHAALTGISAVVAPDGRVLEKSSLFERDLLKAGVRFATDDEVTFYARFGDWVPLMAIAGMVGLWLVRAIRLDPRGARSPDHREPQAKS